MIFEIFFFFFFVEKSRSLAIIYSKMKGQSDCIQCKVIGVSTFAGISTYAAYLRLTTPKSDKGQRLFLGCFVVGAGAIAIWRAIV